MSSYLHEKVGFSGAYDALRALDAVTQAAGVSEEHAADVLRATGVAEAEETLHELNSMGLLRRSGDAVNLTTLGVRTVALLEAVNGGDLSIAFHRLARYDSNLRRYELVREGMTKTFLRNLVDRPGLRRLYICSPWISLDDADRSALMHAITRADMRRPGVELIVITRPSGASSDAPQSIEPLRSLGASVYLHPRLHTKLYIREPGLDGGYSMAIVGSQNLTRSNYLELGIRVNGDTDVISQLTRYFLDLCNASRESI